MLKKLLDLIFPPRSDEAALREVCDDDFLALMAPRLAPETRPGTAVLLPFNAPIVRAAIHEAKYHGSQRAFSLLALALADYLRGLDDIRTARSGLKDSDSRSNLVVLVPIPLGKKRRKERGYNQTEEVARRALRGFSEEGLPISIDPSLLVRVRETESQVALPREKREENMRGAFGAASAVDPSCIYLLIDDVLTTGATLQAAIDALRATGVPPERILPIALAH